MSAVAALLPCGRLHLQHGPIDCICRADGDAREISQAYAQAAAVFADILPTLCRELSALRRPLPAPVPRGPVGRTMHAAVAPFANQYVTPMAAVAGAVADHLLAAMLRERTLRRAFVNNGGDVAIHLAGDERLAIGLVADLASPGLDATLTVSRSGGIATSGRACKGSGGKSFSRGIADAVTVLAQTAAAADAAATMIANAVDLPGHPAILRRPARAIDPASDLGDLLVTVGLGAISRADADAALEAGRRVAEDFRADGRIDGAVLALRGRMVVRGTVPIAMARNAA